MPTLTFQQITDGRFDDPERLLELLNERITAIKSKLLIGGVNVRIGTPYKVEWAARGSEPAHNQYRVDFYVTKTTRKITWQDIYRLVNSVKAVPHKFV